MKPGGDHQAFGVDGACAVQGRGGNGGDFTSANADVADSVQVGGRIHDAAIGDDKVVILRGQRQGQQEQDELS